MSLRGADCARLLIRATKRRRARTRRCSLVRLGRAWGNLSWADATLQQIPGHGYRFLDHNSTDFADRDQNSGTNPLRLYRLKQTIGGGGGGEGNPRGDGTDVGAEPPLLFT